MIIKITQMFLHFLLIVIQLPLMVLKLPLMVLQLTLMVLQLAPTGFTTSSDGPQITKLIL